MDTLALYSKIELLPEHLKKQVLDYIEFLLSREGKGQQLQQQPEVPTPKFKAGFRDNEGMIELKLDGQSTASNLPSLFWF